MSIDRVFVNRDEKVTFRNFRLNILIRLELLCKNESFLSGTGDREKLLSSVCLMSGSVQEKATPQNMQIPFLASLVSHSSPPIPPLLAIKDEQESE